MRGKIEQFCCSEDLSTSDPYDIWKTPLGYQVKRLFNHSRLLGIMPAGSLACFDLFINNRMRLFYRRQEYPIVRALAVLSLLNIYQRLPDDKYLEYSRLHLDWLERHSCVGYSGPCWGLGFPHAVSRGLNHDPNTPFSTMTVYPLEAYVRYTALTGDGRYIDTIQRILRFFEVDIKVMAESADELVTSYGPSRDRIVVNAVSYSMYAYSLLMNYLPDGQDIEKIRDKIRRLYAFIRRNQRDDGAWLYSPQGQSFIDCFHSCIVLKNLIKTDRIEPLDECKSVVRRGYDYLIQNFLDPHRHLFRRFSLNNKPSLIQFDLYDNAEFLNLAVTMGDEKMARDLVSSIEHNFYDGDDIYSQIDILGMKRGANMLRWAVMPYVFALSSRLASSHYS